MLLCCVIYTQAQSNYKIVNKISISGDEGWDLLTMDESSGRLFLTHGNIVQVVDVKSGKLLGTISDLKGVHGIALANDLNKGYITNGRDSSVTIFNLFTLEILSKVQVAGKNPDAILYDEFTHNVFVYNGRTSNATIIDAKTDKVSATIALEGKPELSVTDGKGKVYLNIEDKSKLAVINAKTLKVERYYDIAPGKEASGLAIDVQSGRLFIVCDNQQMVIMDANNGKIITSLPIGERVDGTAFDPGNKRAYSSNGDGTLTVVQEENAYSFKVLENVATQKGARTIAIDTKTHHIYLPSAEYLPAAEPTKENPKPRPSIKPGSFVVLDVMPVK